MENYTNPELTAQDNHQISGSTEWSSPSNLAIIKYWGKHGQQLPRNPSISLTLRESKSITSLVWKPKESNLADIDFRFLFEGKKNIAFAKRVGGFLEQLLPIFPFLSQFSLSFESKNTFPHSSGIASSASAMSALALCLCSMEKNLFNSLEDSKDFYKKASYIARLGSGSASRSVYPQWAQWGDWAGNGDYSNLWASPLGDIHPSFLNMHDSILIASKSEKSVSSSAGHKLMEDNVYASARYQQANDRMYKLENALKSGDWETFGFIAENEALTLHALMMSSEESYILIQPSTLLMIERIRSFRKETKLPVYFSLDAGPNIHLLYPESIKTEVGMLIQNQLLALCEDGMIIYDGTRNSIFTIVESLSQSNKILHR